MQEELILKSYNYFKRAKEPLEDSLMNYEPFNSQKDYTEEELKSYDALSFRFVKFVEMALSLMSTLELYLFAEKSDTLRNRLLRLERAGFLKKGELWLQARALRNEVVHTYMPEELERLFANMVELARELLSESILFEKKVLEALGEKNLGIGG